MQSRDSIQEEAEIQNICLPAPCPSVSFSSVIEEKHVFSLLGKKDTDPCRCPSEFCVFDDSITESDRVKSFAYRPQRSHHDHNLIDIWQNMELYNSHFQGRLNDSVGALRDMSLRTRPQAERYFHELRGRLPTIINTKARFQQIHGRTFQYPSRPHLERQMRSNQRHYTEDF